MRLKYQIKTTNIFCKEMRKMLLTLLLFCLLAQAAAHEAKDFDDTILYKIDFDMPDFDKHPELKDHVRTFYTHEREKYDCVIPVLEDNKEEKQVAEHELSPFTLLQPVLTAPGSCSFRIEAYWSYEVCHGNHVRQYHEEREGKNIKFQEYYLGKWNADKMEQLQKQYEEDRKAGIKLKTTKIDNIKYPYFEMEMSDGTSCDIINAPRTTMVRYVCYQHGKNEIYSFKETSSCNYEAIILTSVLCMIPAFMPEESTEVSIKCYNSPTETHKPLSMLRQELNDLQIADDFPASKDIITIAAALARQVAMGERHMLNGVQIDRLLVEMGLPTDIKVYQYANAAEGVDMAENTAAAVTEAAMKPKATDQFLRLKAAGEPMPLKEFFTGKHCLTGGSGWWKYEFCYGRYVRQFHMDNAQQAELYLGFFDEDEHRKWLTLNPEKATKGSTHGFWHHYAKGTRCDRTGVQREVDVKLSCVSNANAGVSMYLLEPKTCQYILVLEAAFLCKFAPHVDSFGLLSTEKLNQLLLPATGTATATATATKTTAPPTPTPTVEMKMQQFLQEAVDVAAAAVAKTSSQEPTTAEEKQRREENQAIFDQINLQLRDNAANNVGGDDDDDAEVQPFQVLFNNRIDEQEAGPLPLEVLPDNVLA